jgi:Zn-dependent protease
MAVLLGDKGPKYDGRLTVLPSGHLDLVGAISTIVFGLGWTKPVDVDAGEFRIGRVGILAVILAGFAGLLILAVLLDALVRPALTTLPLTSGLTTAAFLRAATDLSVWFALLGLIPIPPFTGGLLLTAFGIRVSPQARWILAVLLLVLVATGLVREVLAPAQALLASLLL